ncbi:DUF6517 family protein [Natronobacterium gregoryi]|uniref:Uncharacterized protein n=2 Tax=Natronobacterium gregoryi TaxID=44930 RepID=L0ALL3_NATGS|nr:DUF6517 family protein [Natronobacterium gregoryi]AFZ74077.1 hypothetical protein Natgr_2940 [Natronobacterium gregoryi SP2]ELY70378.1 hypothetical protein C490_06719 [Natronobacterium gregoryi SP2]PLK20817.1 hypothetical protein CYV19_07885 [Natronobacterium gregoryi SP2]SFJ06079.1 hypothetical protein SAMN05443661_1133 [Natronobacterium gregoryi]
MTTSRRSLLAAGATGTVALTAGCLDFVLGNSPLEFTADRVAPIDTALAETGYEKDDVDERSVEETVDIGVDREVRASLWVSVYAKELRDQSHDASVFASISAPAMEIGSRTINPLTDLSSRELLAEFLDEIEFDSGIEDLEYEDSTELEILDEKRDVETFAGTTEYDGLEVDIEVVLTSFGHDDDLLVLLGSYPDFDDDPGVMTDEDENVERLLQSVEHPV